MHVLVIGAAGMVGRKLVEKLAAQPEVLGFEVSRLTLADAVSPTAPAALPGIAEAVTVDLSKAGAARTLVA
ncbi:MAG: NAD-dependent epimerase/dehydratase family protein, partial [Pseudomonadota bacterium]|nr:NAD-dependent epimerase/dehydratase family protein [Pseudomonadota bacterium]